eukprot:4657451-Pleurochrysis_carterae.AAC.1
MPRFEARLDEMTKGWRMLFQCLVAIRPRSKRSVRFSLSLCHAECTGLNFCVLVLFCFETVGPAGR